MMRTPTIAAAVGTRGHRIFYSRIGGAVLAPPTNGRAQTKELRPKPSRSYRFPDSSRAAQAPPLRRWAGEGFQGLKDCEMAELHAPQGRENSAQGGAKRNPGCVQHRRARSERAGEVVHALKSAFIVSASEPTLSLFQSGALLSILTQGFASLHPGLGSHAPSGRSCPLELTVCALTGKLK
jgi:hypothetical protein